MHIHVRIHRWALWWFYVGLVVGAVALVNILLRDLSHAQERLILMIGVLNWVLGGIVCYGFGGVRIVDSSASARTNESPAETFLARPQKEWHAPSDFVLPGNRQSLLPPKY